MYNCEYGHNLLKYCFFNIILWLMYVLCRQTSNKVIPVVSQANESYHFSNVNCVVLFTAINSPQRLRCSYQTPLQLIRLMAMELQLGGEMTGCRVQLCCKVQVWGQTAVDLPHARNFNLLSDLPFSHFLN